MPPVKQKYGTPKTPIAKRLQDFLNDENSNTIAGKIEMTRQQVSRQLQGEAAPCLKLMVFVAEKGGDLTYILTGKPFSGEAFTPEPTISSPSTGDPWLDIVSANWLRLDTKEKAAFAGEIAAKAEAKSKQDGTNVG